MKNEEVIKILLQYVTEWNCASADEYPYFTDELGHACNDAIKLIQENIKLKEENKDYKLNLEYMNGVIEVLKIKIQKLKLKRCIDIIKWKDS